MKRLLVSVVVLSVLLASGYSTFAEDSLAKKYPNGLPKYMTEEEKFLPIEAPTVEDFVGRAPPTGTVYCPAEYSYNDGIFFAWNSYTDLLTTMTTNITTLTDATVYMVVDSASEESSVTSTLTSAGADLSQVDFIIRNTDTVWIRDYGPRFIYEDGRKAIVDHTYNRPRPNDNALNDYVATLWNVDEYNIPLEHGGGNFHLFANGDAFMTDLILEENPGLSEQDVIDLYAEYQGLNLTIYDSFPYSFDGTKHIDMWMLPVGDYKVVIGQYEPSDGTPYTVTEAAVADLESRGYTVYRTPGWNTGGTHYTYTNGVIINNLFFALQFSGYSTENAQALAVFEAAMPDYTIIPVNCSNIITAAGALHCISMHVPGRVAAMIASPATDYEAAGASGGPFTPASMVYTLENSSPAAIDYEVTQTADWYTVDYPAGSIPSLGSVQITVSINANANNLANGVFEDTFYITNTTNHEGDTARDVVLRVGVPEMVMNWNMDSSPNWSEQGDWEHGVPQGLGGDHGAVDPTSGYTGDNVYGYNLAGGYANSMPETHLTTGALDFTYLSDSHLKFYRWLNVEQPIYDHAYVRVSDDGVNWSEVWENTGPVSDTSWVEVDYDISSYADGRETVYLRWTMGPTDSDWTFAGWNIDDVEIWALNSQVEDCEYDLDDSGFVGVGDINLIKANYGAVTPANEAYDLDDSGFVGVGDINLIKANYGVCP